MKLKNTIFFIYLFCAVDQEILAQKQKVDSLLTVLAQMKEDSNKVNILLDLDIASVKSFSFPQAIVYARQALALSQKINFTSGIGNSYLRIGTLLYFESKFAYAIDTTNKGLKIFEAINDKKGIAGSCLMLGNIYMMQSDYQTAMKYQVAVLDIRKKLGDKKNIAQAYAMIAANYSNQKNLKEAINNYYQALKISEEIKDTSYIAYNLEHIGNINFENGNYDEAEDFLLQALNTYKLSGRKQGLARTYNGLADIYLQKNDLVNSLHYYQAAVDTFVKINETYYILDSYAGIGRVYERIGDSLMQMGNKKAAFENYKVAERHFSASKNIADKKEIKASIVEASIQLGNICIKQLKFKEAKNWLSQGLVLSNETKNKGNLRGIYFYFSRLDSALGDFRSAFEHYKSYISYRDSITNEESTNKMVATQLQYQFEKREDSLRQHQLATETKLDSQQKQKIFYLFGSILLALLSLFVYLNFRNQKKINRLMDDAHAKEKAELELQSLRAQLNPHFMFNSLNAIQELILKEENEKSQTYLARFAKLLRMLLENADKPFIPLQREIDFLRLYLSLENLRIPDLQFSIDVDPDVDTEKTMIPNMILQPYIENAIWHGLSHKEKDKQLRIRIGQSNGITQYEIEDNGVGRRKAAELKSLYRKEHKSKGMVLLSKRFKLLAKEYGSEVETTITDMANDNGTTVTIKVPISLKIN